MTQEISKLAAWQRPFTTRRYLHPPMAEEIVTMWPDVKFIIGEVELKENPYLYQGAGLKVLRGDSFEEIDFKTARYEVHPEGYPIHSFVQEFEQYDLRVEAFCNTCRVPDLHVEITVKNKVLWETKESLSLIARTGDEFFWEGINYDGYSHLDTNVHTWGLWPNAWKQAEGGMTDGKYSVSVFGQDFSQKWIAGDKGSVWAHRNLLRLDFTLRAGEEKKLRLVFRKGKLILEDNYEAAKKDCESFWKGELSKITVFPNRENPSYYTMYRSLVSNCLQMFCHPVGEEYVLPRQGGMQRNIWPAEAVWMLSALDKIGDFSSYTETALALYFDRLQIKEGEDEGRIATLSGSVGWAMDTGAVVQTAACHMLYKGESAFRKYRGQTYAAFRWIERQRESTKSGNFAGKGLMPPMRSCDWGEVAQTWTKTDAAILLGYRAIRDAFVKYSDPAAAEIESAYADYLSCMRAVLADVSAKNPSTDELILPMHAGTEPQDPPMDGPYIMDGPLLIYSEVADPNGKEARLIENYYVNRGLFKNGLKGQMSTANVHGPWAGHTWYIGYCNHLWYHIYRAQGRENEALEILHADLKYGMTAEYYTVERYADNDPYFVPWTPNASENGRIIDMLCTHFGV